MNNGRTTEQLLINYRNYSAKATNYPKLGTVTVKMCSKFVCFDLRVCTPCT